MKSSSMSSGGHSSASTDALWVICRVGLLMVDEQTINLLFEREHASSTVPTVPQFRNCGMSVEFLPMNWLSPGGGPVRSCC